MKAWGGRKSRTLWNLVAMAYGTRCIHCGEPIDMAYCDEFIYGHNNPLRPSVDHVIPRAMGGSDRLENLRPAHLGCNAARGARHRPRRRTAGDLALVGAIFS